MMSKQATRLSDFQIPRGLTEVSPSVQSEQQSLQQSATVSRPLTDIPDTLPDVISPQPPTSVSAPLPPAPMPAVPAAPTMATLPQALAPTEVPRRALGARVPVLLAERLRAYLYVSRRSQQEVVEAALDAYLSANGA